VSTAGPETDLVLVHGIFCTAPNGLDKKARDRISKARTAAFSEHASSLGVRSYEWLDGCDKAWANKMLARMRGTAPTVDAVEIIALNSEALQKVLEIETDRAQWRKVTTCESGALDLTRSFILMGSTRLLLQGDLSKGKGSGQRLIWFGNGLDQLSREEFIAHYTTRHGPLVAGHAQLMGLRQYRQVPDEQEEFCAILRELGFGQAPPPAAFAELVMGAPSIKLSSLRAYRAAAREIKEDEKRHIDFGRSMLLLAGKQGPEFSAE
jgi:EthD domain